MRPIQSLSLLAMFLISTAGYGQTQAPTSREPEKKKAFHDPHYAKAPKIKKRKVKHTARYEFYKRVEMAAREKQKILKQLSKAQFSDHRHFGHKRLPKRHPSHKMRYCNECGIRH